MKRRVDRKGFEYDDEVGGIDGDNLYEDDYSDISEDYDDDDVDMEFVDPSEFGDLDG